MKYLQKEHTTNYKMIVPLESADELSAKRGVVIFINDLQFLITILDIKLGYT